MAMVKARISNATRKQVFARDKSTCQTCGLCDVSGGLLTMGHVTAETMGGDNTEYNLVVQCHACQQIQGAVSLPSRPVWLGRVWHMPAPILANQRAFRRAMNALGGVG